MTEYFEGDSQGTFADVVDGPVADALEGESIDEIAEAHDLLRESDVPDGDLIEAISAVDIALYDVLGKQHGVPVYELLADEFGTDAAPTTELDLYASAGMYMEPDGYVEQAQVLEELGFFGYKYRPGIGPEGDRETVERLAEAVDDIDLMLDVHTWWKLRESYDRATVRERIVHAADHGAYWIEEPVEPDDHKGYVDLTTTGAPLAGGESEDSAAGLVALGETGAVDFLQGDVRHHEGFTGCRVAVTLCAGRDDLEFVPHNLREVDRPRRKCSPRRGGARGDARGVSRLRERSAVRHRHRPRNVAVRSRVRPDQRTARHHRRRPVGVRRSRTRGRAKRRCYRGVPVQGRSLDRILLR